jgi:hypothetical protein
MQMKENRRKRYIYGLQAEGRRFESVNAHKMVKRSKDKQSQQKTRSLLVSRLTDFFVFHRSQIKPEKDTKRQGIRGQIVDLKNIEKLSTNGCVNTWKLLSYNDATWRFQRFESLDDK